MKAPQCFPDCNASAPARKFFRLVRSPVRGHGTADKDSEEIRPRHVWGDSLRHHPWLAALTLLLLSATPGLAQTRFALSLDPVAFDNSTRDTVGGEGRVTATLNGNTLTLQGAFSGLTSPATAARLGLGLDFAVPGDFFADLSVARAQAGAISGTVTLTSAQLAGLRRRAVMLQIDSVRGTTGSLWGWFEPVTAPADRGR